MGNQYRYYLESRIHSCGSSRIRKHRCPQCGQDKVFVRYVDTITNQYLPEQYGRCDREEKCTYWLNPYKDGYHKTGESKEWKPQPIIFKLKPERVFIAHDVYRKTLQGYDRNQFINNLLNNVPFPFVVGDVKKVIDLYGLGTVTEGYMTGAVTFPFIDKASNIHTIQAKQFDKDNRTTRTSFLHAIIESYLKKKGEPLPQWLEAYQKNEGVVTCLFGEHLLSKYPKKKVALVEAPKTAIYGTLYYGFDDVIWLAVYNKSSFTFEKLKALQGRDVTIFPDLSKEGNTFKEWKCKAKDFESKLPGTTFTVSDTLEKETDPALRAKGLDLADYLIRYDWKSFRPNTLNLTLIEQLQQAFIDNLAIAYTFD